DDITNSSAYVWKFGCDVTPPSVTDIDGFDDPTKMTEYGNSTTIWHADQTVYFEWTVTDGSSGVNSLYYYYWGTSDSGDPTTAVFGNSLPVSCMSDGTWYFRVKAYDVAGNFDIGSFVYMYDSTTPDIDPVTCRTENGGTLIPEDSWTNDASVSFEWDIPSPNCPSGVTYYYVINTSATPCVDNSDTALSVSYIDDVPLSTDGTYYFHVRAQNGAWAYGTE
ncbi:unnamed protein product, partial [marine sediment metagenome]